MTIKLPIRKCSPDKTRHHTVKSVQWPLIFKSNWVLVRMSQALTIIIAQQNYALGDIEGNAAKIVATANSCQGKADIIVFSELTLTAYPPEDLLLRPELQHRVDRAIETIKKATRNIYLVIGHPHKIEQQRFNAASVIYNGKIVDRYYKHHLPNYSVFDEKRYFTSGNKSCIITIKDTPIAITICEDLWQEHVLEQAVDAGAKAILSLNASPFHFKKQQEREKNLQQRQATEGHIPIIYVNCVGGQDELVFDGQSFVLDGQGNVCARAPAYQECLLPVELIKQDEHLTIQTGQIAKRLSEEALIYEALVLGTRDYIEKNNFPGALLGVSGGIDSALTLAIVYDAIGKERVHAVLMPSRYTSELSIDTALEMLTTLDIKHNTISIEPAFEALLTSLDDALASIPSLPHDHTKENLQARCRGTLLMALSNKTGNIVLTTGNKSEMAVGYATLYGDMAGGFAVLKDVPKTLVYRLANYRNQIAPIIPQAMIDRAPSAELAFNQTDQDALPPYSILDAIIKQHVEYNKSIQDMVQAGLDTNTVQKVVSLIDQNEYKRRQAPPGIRISKRAFGRDWRYPITATFSSGVKKVK